MNNGYIPDTTYDTPTREPCSAYDITMYNKVLDHFVSLSPEKVIARIFGECEEHLLSLSDIKEFLSTDKAIHEGWTLCCKLPNVEYRFEMACFPLEENINIVFFAGDRDVVRASSVEVLPCRGSEKDYPVFCYDVKTNNQCAYRDLERAFDPSKEVC